LNTSTFNVIIKKKQAVNKKILEILLKAKGTFHLTSKGFAFVVSNDGKEFFIPPNKFSTALDGDFVEVIAQKSKKGFRGRVISIIKRADLSIQGIYKKTKEYGVIEPYKPFPCPIIVPFGAELKAKNGDFVVAKIVPPKKGKRADSLRACVIRKLNMPQNIKDDLRAIVIKHNLSLLFPKEVEIEAKELAKIDMESELKHRRDLRNRLLFTIDSIDARDFDDAVGIEKYPDGSCKLTVAIADVSYIVQEGSFLDQEAFNRSFSVYFPETTIPMLPEIISNGVMSLRPDEDKLAIVVEIELGSKGKILNCNCFEAVIRSKARLTYEEVGPFLEGKTPSPINDAEIIESLKELNKLAEILYRKRKKMGSLDFDLPEIRIALDSAGEVIDVFKRERDPSQRLIEEAMLIANQAVCEFLKNKKSPVLYRIHETPAKEDLFSFCITAEQIGLEKNLIFELRKAASKSTSSDTKPINIALQNIADSVRGDPIERFSHQQILRALRQAKYSEFNAGHFGLGFNNYLHFTSPIRRYPDLIVHRILKDVLRSSGLSKKDSAKWQKKLKKIALQTSQKERTTDAAMHDLLKLKKAAYMKRYIGETFSGIVSSILSFGMFVEIVNPPVDGLVSLEDLGYARIIENKCIEIKKHHIALGDMVQVKIKSVDVQKGFIDLILA
jgi:ribonuclease R